MCDWNPATGELGGGGSGRGRGGESGGRVDCGWTLDGRAQEAAAQPVAWIRRARW